MRFLLPLIAGVVLGAALVLGALLFNPFNTEELSPLVVSERAQLTYGFSPVPADAIVLTNSGETRTSPVPEKVTTLWEEPIRQTEVLVTELVDVRGTTIGIGIKFSSASEQTNVIRGEALVDSVWHLSMPGRGTAFVQQTENYWNYLRDVVLPARWSASDSWKGTWRGTLSSGPGALGTARVYGGSGIFEDVDADAIETRYLKAYSAESGPVAAEGSLIIELPELPAETVAESPE